MKAKITTLFLAVCTVLLSNAQYCTPTYTNLCTSGDLIDNFTFSTLSNLATGCNGDTDNYSFDTTITTVVYLGNTYNISMQSGPTWPQGFGVWIDYNQDGDFGDAGEFVYASPTSATTPFNSTVTIPAGAAQGTTRLRVRCAWSTILTWADTCNLQTYGEMEDYEITITPPPPIDGGVTVITSPISDCALSSSENVVVDIANFGSDTIFGLSVYYSINGGAPVAEVLSDTILPGNTLSHLFSTPANLLATGSYFFDAWAGITGDTVALNDSTVNYQVDNQAGLSSFPYMEDFDPLNLITQSA
ncbi:hypothetical protein JYU20_01530, partial [Bacteroidales bacterium AH-315-I05]|nr:hypothetical protein [Bacteroidales bacterium AH-315-I05]